MKLFSILLPLVFLLSSCSKEETTYTRMDYTVLGISQVTVNGVVLFPLKDTKNLAPINIEGMYLESPCEDLSGHYVIKYYVKKHPSTEPLRVVGESKYPDVEITYEEKVINEIHKAISVTFTRKGYEPKVTYTFVFLFAKNSN